jgi:ribosomal protein L27
MQHGTGARRSGRKMAARRLGIRIALGPIN